MSHRRLVRGLVFVAIATAALPDLAAPPDFFRMKQVKVVDAHGFEKPLTVATLLVPIDWSLQSDVHYDPKNACTANLVRVSFRAASPDGRTSIELFPSAVWNWSDDPNSRQFMEQERQMKAQYGMKGCDIGPPLAAREYLSRHLIPRARPGARVTGAEVDPEAAKGAASLVRQVEAQMARGGVAMQFRVDTSKVRIAYDLKGQAEEEWVTGATFARGMPMPTFNPMTGQMGRALSYACGAEFLFGLSAPKGRLEASDKLFRAILGSIRVDPEWEARVAQVQANIHATELKGAADRSRIIARSAEDTRQIMSGTYERRQASQDRMSQQWSQYMRGVETYRNPSTGETVELSNRYGNAWSNGKNEYLLSDSPGFDPNTVTRENWTRLQPVKPGQPTR